MSQQLHFVVVVMGDVGRSPRMQYHAMSLLQLGEHVRVSLIGYTGEDLIDDLKECHDDRLDVIRFHIPTPSILQKIRPLYFLYRVIAMYLSLLWVMFVSVRSKPEVNCLLVQNPPALPLLFMAYLFCRIKAITQQRKPLFVIDWHNLGYTMLSSNLLRNLVQAYEKCMAPYADGHLTVTSAMQSFLVKNMNVDNNNINVLNDCPPTIFQPLTDSEIHDVMSKLHKQLCGAIPRSWNLDSLDRSQQTILTRKSGKDATVEPRSGRPAFVTSSTSWTPDEDFGLFLEALVILDDTIQKNESVLKVLVVVTGKGPQKAFYEEKISLLKMTSVAIQTVWLDPGDYPKLLACADVAVSLHTSTSGLDLPMKILDSYGCHVPVCARDFECLSELVQDHHNGRIFQSQSELASQLWTLLSPLTKQANAAPHSFGDLAVYSNNLKGRKRWQSNWTENALPVLLPGAETDR